MNQDILLYEGQEPYIFVSYCYKDKESVIPVIQRMIEKGYRIWFDRGIHPGSEWPEIVRSVHDFYFGQLYAVAELHP